MRRLPALFIVIVAMPVHAADKPGSIAGVVRFTGNVPPATRVTTADGGVILHHDLIVDAKTKGLRDVFARLENAANQPKVAKLKSVLMDQREMLFVPRIVAVQHGQSVRFDNSDTCNHSVMASSAVKENQFNLFVAPGKPYEHAFEPQKLPVLIGCSLHGWMRAWVYVSPHPWFALSDEHGTFRITDIPSGKYTLWLHHADGGKQERREVEITAGKTLELAVEWTKIDP